MVKRIYLYAKGSLSSAFKGKLVSMLVRVNNWNQEKRSKNSDYTRTLILAKENLWCDLEEQYSPPPVSGSVCCYDRRFPIRLSHFHPSFWVPDWGITVAAELVGVTEITWIKPLTGERTGRMWCMQLPSPAVATLTVQIWGQPALFCHSRMYTEDCSLLFLNSAVFTLCSYPGFHPLLCSPPLSVWFHTAPVTRRTPPSPSPAEAEPSLNFNFVSAASCRCAKGYNNGN